SNGQPGATLTIRKRGQADLITTVNAVHTLLADEKLPDGVGARILMDQSLLTRGRISLLISNAAMGFGLVLLILMYFLDYKTAIWTAFGIPVTLLGMLIFLKWQNISINLISLAGFIILIGMIVDDAVVIAEEFNTNREHGMLSSEAAIAAVKRMWKPIFASSATTMIAFAPLFIVGGFPGAFIWVIPLMVIVGLLVSLLESFVMLPVHLAHGKHRPSKEKKIIITLERWYVITLTFFLRHRYIVLVALLILLLFSAALFRFAVRKDPFPQDAADAFNIVVTLPPHFTVERSTRELKQIEQMLLRLPAQELLGFSTRQGTQSEDSTNDRGIQGNLAIIMVYLHPFENRTRQATEIMAALEEELATLARQNQMEYGLLLKRLGPPMGRAVEVRVIAADDEERKQRSTEILNFLKGVNGIVHLESDERLGLSESQVVLNERLIAAAELREQDILNSLRIALDGLVVTTIRSADLNTDVRLRLAEDLQSPEQLIQNIPVVNRQGRLLELNRFVSFIESQGAATINHIHGVRTTTIYGDIDPERTSPTAIMAELQAHFPDTPAVRLEYSGQAVETRLIFGGLTMAGLAAVVGIYLMIALIFNSFTRPIVVMASLPFMAIGAAFTLVGHNVPGSMMVGVAIVGLMGVIVNASIVLVDTIQSGTMKIDTDSIINGARSRLRPIFLSTATTVLGVLPTGYGIGGFDPFLSHMSLVLAYGLAAGTFIVLIIVPVLLQISLDLERALARRIQG
ncbi:MAG: efflux RND transporter permease subunit, partial [Leptospiraceae bacterium]|nr:efflux RND transporter permease subunit [Leptospiraceae bacterium]